MGYSLSSTNYLQEFKFCVFLSYDILKNNTNILFYNLCYITVVLHIYMPESVLSITFVLSKGHTILYTISENFH